MQTKHFVIWTTGLCEFDTDGSWLQFLTEWSVQEPYSSHWERLRMGLMKYKKPHLYIDSTFNQLKKNTHSPSEVRKWCSLLPAWKVNESKWKRMNVSESESNWVLQRSRVNPWLRDLNLPPSHKSLGDSKLKEWHPWFALNGYPFTHPGSCDLLGFVDKTHLCHKVRSEQ